MAKLSARGRKPVVEATREYDLDTLQRAHDRYERSYKPDYVDGADPSLTIWERATRRLMSDGTIIEKRDVRFRPTPNCTWDDPKGRYYSYGWKVYGKLKVGLTAEDFARIYSENTKSGKPSAWTVTRSGFVPANVISQRRNLGGRFISLRVQGTNGARYHGRASYDWGQCVWLRRSK